MFYEEKYGIRKCQGVRDQHLSTLLTPFEKKTAYFLAFLRLCKIRDPDASLKTDPNGSVFLLCYAGLREGTVTIGGISPTATVPLTQIYLKAKQTTIQKSANFTFPHKLAEIFRCN